jgi:hypothetical protein
MAPSFFALFLTALHASITLEPALYKSNPSQWRITLTGPEPRNVVGRLNFRSVVPDFWNER